MKFIVLLFMIPACATEKQIVVNAGEQVRLVQTYNLQRCELVKTLQGELVCIPLSNVSMLSERR